MASEGASKKQESGQTSKGGGVSVSVSGPSALDELILSAHFSHFQVKVPLTGRTTTSLSSLKLSHAINQAPVDSSKKLSTDSRPASKFTPATAPRSPVKKRAPSPESVLTLLVGRRLAETLPSILSLQARLVSS